MLSRFSKAFIMIIIALFLLGSIALLHPPSRAYVNPWTGEMFGEGGVEQELAGAIPPPRPPLSHGKPAMNVQDGSSSTPHGGVIMSKLGNATAKAELGRATWKLLHTVTLRFPEDPSQDERDALNDYFHLFSRLYPCGECATEFQKLLKRFPPQTSSRRAAATWLCAVHNEVNKRLQKPEFDCANLDATYDCGCGDEPLNLTATTSTSNSANTALGIVHDDPMDLELDPTKDEHTGVGLIKGGR
ncbi:ERV/ALR sulfhydryl oxidase domain-containing protein [Abortiporus biennis]|nr:ERV/ALR sulfhydryl oxidase domain-containing protein [Abortiporus biennis]